jgi:hypothetical protein
LIVQARKAAVQEKAEKRAAFLENQRIKAEQLKEQREREKVGFKTLWKEGRGVLMLTVCDCM